MESLKQNDFAFIKGQEAAKRAALVSLVGPHSITFYGPSGGGKSMLCEALASAGHNRNKYEFRPCPCGNLTDPRKSCMCDKTDIVKHLQGLHTEMATDICVEVPPIPVSYLFDKQYGTTTTQIVDLAQRAKAVPPIQNPLHAFNNDAQTIMKQAYSELGLSIHSAVKIASVADSIRRLSGELIIGATHVSEAILYRRIDALSIVGRK